MAAEVVLLQDESFCLCTLKDLEGVRCGARLTTDRLSFGQRFVDLDDITGCLCMKAPPPPSGAADSSATASAAYLTVYAYSLVKTATGSVQRRRQELLLRCDRATSFADNWSRVDEWRRAILRAARPTDLDDPPKLLIFVNPMSGSGTALKTFNERMRSFLGEADLGYELVVTERSGHCADVVRTTPDLKQRYLGLVAVSGDGLLYEIYNGLLERDDWPSIADMAVGIIPQGSGNGLARSLAHFNGEPYLNDPLTVSVLNVLKLRTVAVDLCLVNTPQRPSMCSFLSVGWGLIADIDIESERLRALGEARFTFWALHRVLHLRTYEATVWYRPIEGGGAATPTPLPPLDEPLAEADGWRTQSGSFVCVYSTVAPYLGTDLFLAPDKRPADGVIWLLIIKAPVTKMQMVQFLLALGDGKHRRMPFVQLLAVSAFRLIPAGSSSYVTVDGERLDAQPVQAQLLPGHKGRVFMR